MNLRLVLLSDTHGLHGHINVPEGDVLIHAGDLCNTDSEQDVLRFAAWIDRLPHRWKVVIAGNHDGFFQRQPGLARAYLESGVIYLQDSGCEIEGVRFWGSPWQPCLNWAFNLPRKGQAIREKWNQIPMDTDVLITHGPPFGILDEVRARMTAWGPSEEGSGPLGCEELHIRVQTIKPKLHVFGHIHDGYGVLQGKETTFVNASICTEAYKPTNPPIVLDLVTKNGMVKLRNVFGKKTAGRRLDGVLHDGYPKSLTQAYA